MKQSKFRKDYEKFYKESPKKEFWGDYWQEICERVHKKKRGVLVKELLKCNHSHIADIGCGTGIIVKLLRKKGFKGKLSAIDIHLPKKLKERAKKFNVHIEKGDFKRIKTNKYDAIVFFSCLHYATINEVEKIIKNFQPCEYFYIIEAFKEFPENVTLDKKVRQRTKDRCGIFSEFELDNVFSKKRYKAVFRYIFPLDELGRTLVFKIYKK